MFIGPVLCATTALFHTSSCTLMCSRQRDGAGGAAGYPNSVIGRETRFSSTNGTAERWVTCPVTFALILYQEAEVAKQKSCRESRSELTVRYQNLMNP